MNNEIDYFVSSNDGTKWLVWYWNTHFAEWRVDEINSLCFNTAEMLINAGNYNRHIVLYKNGTAKRITSRI